MKIFNLATAAAVLTLAIGAVSHAAEPVQPQNTPKILTATFSGVISPVSAEYLSQAVKKANSDSYDILILRLDTPGGLDLSMREIIKEIMASKVPVVTYVYPQGGRAASAGVFIAMASHIVAMAPGTNIGAAHPVMLGATGTGGEKGGGKNTMEAKVLNDASAYMKSITQERGRNVDWAIQAVTKSDSISAEEALKMKVTDIIAIDTNDLLAKLEGREVSKFGKLRTTGASVSDFPMTRRQQFLAAISDPNVAMILMSLGAAGLFIELYNPGLILPGVVGAVSLVLAFYSLQTLSANMAGALLILLGIVFLIAEIHVVSYGLLAIAGIGTLLLGATMLFKTQASMGLSISAATMFTTIGTLVLVILAVGFIALKAQFRKVSAGAETLIGKKGIIKKSLEPKGLILVDGELWDAVPEGEAPKAGEMGEIVARNGFTLTVKKSA